MNSPKYISKYSNGKSVSAAQYITELICEHKAKKDRLDLHYRFWTSRLWDRFYRDQIATSHKLLKKYSANAIINALMDPETAKIYSLRAPHLPPIIEKHESIIARQNKQMTLDIDRNINKTHRQPRKQNSIISKLKDIDNGS